MCLADKIEQSKRVVVIVVKGNGVHGTEFVAGEERDYRGVVDIDRLSAPLSCITVMANHNKRMRARRGIASTGSDMNSVNKPAIPIGCSANRRRADSRQLPRRSVVIFVKVVPISSQHDRCQLAVLIYLPQRRNKFRLPLIVQVPQPGYISRSRGGQICSFTDIVVQIVKRRWVVHRCF